MEAPFIGCSVSGDISGARQVGDVIGISTGSLAIAKVCYWSGYDGNGSGLGSGETTKVDGTAVTWADAVDAMNTALSDKGWQYALTGALPTLKKQ